MSASSLSLRVLVDVVGTEQIDVCLLRGADKVESSYVRDVDSAMARLESWLRYHAADTYEVVVTGADGIEEAELAPNRHLALYFIATSLARAVTRGADRHGAAGGKVLDRTAE